MKFITYIYNGSEQTGILDGSRVYPLDLLPDLKGFSMLDLIAVFDDHLLETLKAMIITRAAVALPLDAIILRSPIPYPRRNVFCLGKNYVDHVREIKMTATANTDIPDAPIYFSKIAWPAAADGDDITFSYNATSQVDYEVELALIIGRDGINIKAEDAEDYIFGYTVANDVSARDLQGQHRQWFKGKGLDTFCPLGPAIVHKSAIPAPVRLAIQCRVNGELRQDSNTGNMIFDIPFIISDLSKGMTLKAGDIICTGTPSGVGMGFDPPRFLADGDLVECFIEIIGTLTNRIKVVNP
jgi:2-keto-4-pentenoate hydratase/2-oxohepta-3-ene-1,7-dioic acid hydratase in catechol pathway